MTFIPRNKQLPIPDVANSPEQRLLGAGRSGRVYGLDFEGTTIARKIFFGEPITHLIHYFFFGAPNPYIWNEDALWCAYYRRKILTELVKVWFGSYLKVSNALDVGWEVKTRAYLLDTEFIAGRPVALSNPFSGQEANSELSEQLEQIMNPLHRHLLESGFHGMLWQVGKGNPSAFNNFLLTENLPHHHQFAWIDLESGVPALFPINPLILFNFYLPQAIHRRKALFDDVDVNKLKRYLETRSSVLIDELGSDCYTNLQLWTKELAYHQQRWKTMGRTIASIEYQRKKGNISLETAQWYQNHPLAWYSRELRRFCQITVYLLCLKLPKYIFEQVHRFNYKKALRSLWQYTWSHRYRLALARKYVINRIRVWEEREQITTKQAEELVHRFQYEQGSDYLNDFGVHVALKIPVKVIRYTLLPSLYAAGLINEITLVFLLASGGMIIRLLYTSFRMFEASLQGQRLPWVAFGIGFIPFLSNLAYPLQMIYSATQRQGEKVAQFIVYDSITSVGTAFPAWGGKDTLIEHWFNRLAKHLIGRLRQLGRKEG